MHLERMRDGARRLVVDERRERLRTARLWHCKYVDIDALAACTSLERLVIASYPAADLRPIAGLTRLRALRLLHMPKVQDVSPLGSLLELESLELATLPSWDASRKRSVVSGLDALGRLPRLRWLQLYGVVSNDRSLAALQESSSLRGVRVSGFPAVEAERYYAHTGVSPTVPPEAGAEHGMPAPFLRGPG